MVFEKGNKHGKRFPPGESGNPAGRPPRRKFHEIIEELLELKVREVEGELHDKALAACGDKDKTIGEALGIKTVSEAMAGDLGFCRMLIERTDGKVSDKLQFTDTDAEMKAEQSRKLLTPLVIAIAKRKGMIVESPELKAKVKALEAEIRQLRATPRETRDPDPDTTSADRIEEPQDPPGRILKYGGKTYRELPDGTREEIEIPTR